MNFILVTCIFDLPKRGVKVKRSLEVYLSLFQWLINLDLEIILFTEPHIKLEIERIHKLPHLTIIEMNLEDLPNYQKMNHLNLSTPINCPELTNLYTVCITSKIWLLSKVHEIHPNKHLVWIDAGISHVTTIEKQEFIDHLQIHLHHRIVLVMMRATSKHEIVNLTEFLKVNHGKIAAGLMICPSTEIKWLVKEMNNLFDQAINDIKQLCLEEQLLAIISTTNRDKFDYIFSDYWMLPNLKYLRVRIQTVISNLSYCRMHLTSDDYFHELGLKILKHLLNSIKDAKYDLPHDQLCHILYEGQIVSYYRDRQLSKDLGRLIHYLYHYQDTCHNWFKQQPLLKDNLKFVDIDLENSNGAMNVLKDDISKYIWTAL